MSSLVCYAFNSHDFPEDLSIEIQRLGGQVVEAEAPSDRASLVFQNGNLFLTPGTVNSKDLHLNYQDKYSDFLSRASKPKGPLGKAIGLDKNKHISLVDGMLGSGTDTLLMLSWGVRITAFERSPAIYLINWFEHQKFIKNNPRIHFDLQFGDVRECSISADVLYLDPMYPHTRNKRLSKKEMQFFNLLAGKDTDENEVFDWAMEQDFKRVVIKRPPKAEVYGKPTHSYESKSVRYDMYSFKPLY